MIKSYWTVIIVVARCTAGGDRKHGAINTLAISHVIAAVLLPVVNIPWTIVLRHFHCDSVHTLAII